jgi:hypothetical protein
VLSGTSRSSMRRGIASFKPEYIDTRSPQKTITAAEGVSGATGWEPGPKAGSAVPISASWLAPGWLEKGRKPKRSLSMKMRTKA